MKRFFALILVLALGLSLTACGQQERYPEIADLLDAGEYEKAMLMIYALYQQENPTAPTEDPVLTRKYETLTSAVESLTHYVENLYDLDSFSFIYYNGSEHIQYQGMDAVACLYETAVSLGEYENAAEIAGQFTVLEDVPLEKIYWYSDVLGNVTESSRVYYIYGADGSLLSQGQDNGIMGDHYLYNHGIPEYTRDENGNLIRLRYFSGSATNCVIDYTYNSDGTVASEHYLDRTGSEYTITYHYEDGVLVRAQGIPYAEGSAETMTVEYHYDEQGKLILESGIRDGWNESSASQFVKTVHYRYNEAGQLTCVRKATEYYIKKHFDDTQRVLEQYQDVREWTYAYDAEGRLVRNTYAVIGATDPEGTPLNGEYRTYTGDTQYGSYYVYTPASMDVR